MAGQADERDESVDLRGTVVARLPGDTRLRVGDRLPVTLHLDALSLFDADSGESLLKPS